MILKIFRKMKKIVIIVVLFSVYIFGGTAFCSSSEQKIVYEDIYSGEVAVFYPKIKEVSHLDHRQQYKECKRDNDLMCIESEMFDFAVPRSNELHIGQTWKNNGLTYRVKKRRHLSILGKEVDAYLIVSKMKIFSAHYLYSEKYGLVAFGSTLKNGCKCRVLKILRGNIGLLVQR